MLQYIEERSGNVATKTEGGVRKTKKARPRLRSLIVGLSQTTPPHRY